MTTDNVISFTEKKNNNIYGNKYIKMILLIAYNIQITYSIINTFASIDVNKHFDKIHPRKGINFTEVKYFHSKHN